jgi:hypothetical protein
LPIPLVEILFKYNLEILEIESTPSLRGGIFWEGVEPLGPNCIFLLPCYEYETIGEKKVSYLSTPFSED